MYGPCRVGDLVVTAVVDVVAAVARCRVAVVVAEVAVGAIGIPAAISFSSLAVDVVATVMVTKTMVDAGFPALVAAASAVVDETALRSVKMSVVKLVLARPPTDETVVRCDEGLARPPPDATVVRCDEGLARPPPDATGVRCDGLLVRLDRLERDDALLVRLDRLTGDDGLLVRLDRPAGVAGPVLRLVHPARGYGLLLRPDHPLRVDVPLRPDCRLREDDVLRQDHPLRDDVPLRQDCPLRDDVRLRLDRLLRCDLSRPTSEDPTGADRVNAATRREPSTTHSPRSLATATSDGSLATVPSQLMPVGQTLNSSSVNSVTMRLVNTNSLELVDRIQDSVDVECNSVPLSNRIAVPDVGNNLSNMSRSYSATPGKRRALHVLESRLETPVPRGDVTPRGEVWGSSARTRTLTTTKNPPHYQHGSACCQAARLFDFQRFPFFFFFFFFLFTFSPAIRGTSGGPISLKFCVRPRILKHSDPCYFVFRKSKMAATTAL